MRNELHMAQAAPADVAAVTRAPLFGRLLRRVVEAWEDDEDDDRVVTPRQPLDSAEPPRAASMLLAAYIDAEIR